MKVGKRLRKFDKRFSRFTISCERIQTFVKPNPSNVDDALVGKKSKFILTERLFSVRSASGSEQNAVAAMMLVAASTMMLYVMRDVDDKTAS